MKVALVHDYLNDFGGAERVLLALSEIYPKALIYTIFYKEDSPCSEHFKNKTIKQSWFSRLPYSHRIISPLRFLIPFIWSTFDFSKYDLVITSASWAVTKGMKKGPETREICYLHTPPRYLYGYDTSRDWKNKWFSNFVKIYSLIVNHFMRMYDFNQAQKVDYFIANSQNVGKRIEKFYRRDYNVIYPPVEVHNLSHKNSLLRDKNYYLTGGRLVAAKNFGLIIRAFNKLGAKLIIFGGGIEENKLRLAARENIEFVGRVSDQELAKLYEGAKAFVAAQRDEDFGITLVEAAAAGCPSIAYKAEGYIESVIEGKTGVFFEKLTSESIIAAIRKFERMKLDVSECKKHAQKFSGERFKREMVQFVKSYARAS